jgi:hypothetical protein
MKLLFIIIVLSFSGFAHSQEILTRGEVFDYNVGDEFHHLTYRNYFMDDGDRSTKWIVTDKYYSENQDTVFYVADYLRIINNYDNNYNGELEQWTHEFHFTDLSEELSMQDSVYIDPDRFNGKEIHHFSEMQAWQEEETFNQNHTINEYVATLGRVRNSFSFWHEQISVGHTSSLVYYYKADTGEEWGTQLTLSTSELDLEKKIKVFPNPSKGIFNWELESIENDIPQTLYVYSLEGKKLLHRKLNPAQNSIDLSDLDQGIFILEFQTENGIIRKRIVLE